MKTAALKIALPLVALSMLTACGSGSSDDSKTNPMELVNEGELTVCTNPPYRPFEFEDGGEIVGFDMDLTKEIAKDLGLKHTTVHAGFDAMNSGAVFQSKQCDLIATGMTINDVRKEKFDFARPYVDVKLAALVPDDSPINSVEKLKSAKVSVQVDSTGKFYSEREKLNFVEQKDLGLQVQMVQTGQADAAVGDLPVLSPYAADPKNKLKIAFEIPQSKVDQFGLAVKKGNDKLLKAVNKTLDRVSTDGTYDKLWKQWVGGTSPGMPKK